MEEDNLLKKLGNFKMQLVINKTLYIDEVISKEMYESVESHLLENIKTITKRLESV